MRISIERLKNEILPDKYYKDYVLGLLSGYKELDSVLMIKMLLRNACQEEADDAYPGEALDFDILELANTLLIYSLNNLEIVNYTIYAVKQVLPYLKADFPGVELPHQVLRITETYFKELIKNEIDLFAYKHVLSGIIREAYLKINASTDANVFWVTYAANLTAYASIYAFSNIKKPTRKLAEVCALNAVYMALSYSSVTFNRVAVLKEIILYGLRMLKLKHCVKNKIIYLDRYQAVRYSIN